MSEPDDMSDEIRLEAVRELLEFARQAIDAARDFDEVADSNPHFEVFVAARARMRKAIARFDAEDRQ